MDSNMASMVLRPGEQVQCFTSVEFRERESGVGSGTGGTTVNVENAFGWSLYGIPERVLRLGESTEIVKMTFSVSKDGQRVPVTVRAALQENPDGRIGSSGRVQTISR
jgi:hypothetical protein